MRKQITYLIAIYSILAGGFLATEVLFRIFLPPTSALSVFAKNTFAFNTRASYGRQIFESDPLLGWKLMPSIHQAVWDFTDVTTNDQGYRYHKNIGLKKTDTVRIVALGDSVTFGYRVPLVYPMTAKPNRLQRSYPQLMEDYLQEKNPMKQIEVVPMAVPGYSSFQGLKWFERDGLSLKPDLVTIMYGWNDTDLNAAPDIVSLQNSKLAVISRAVISKSQILTKIAGIFSDKSSTVSVANTSVRVSEEDYVNNILAIAGMAMSNGSKIVIIGQVYRDSSTNPAQAKRVADYRQALAEAAKSHGIPYLEIDELTEGSSPANGPLFGELIHPNSDGHKLIADRLLSLIAQDSMLGSLSY